MRQLDKIKIKNDKNVLGSKFCVLFHLIMLCKLFLKQSWKQSSTQCKLSFGKVRNETVTTVTHTSVMLPDEFE